MACDKTCSELFVRGDNSVSTIKYRFDIKIPSVQKLVSPQYYVNQQRGISSTCVTGHMAYRIRATEDYFKIDITISFSDDNLFQILDTILWEDFIIFPFR